MEHRTVIFIALGLLSANLGAQTTTGTWQLYPPQTQNSTQLSIRPPVNSDGSSVWSVKATIPIQYDVMIGYGPVLFESLQSGDPAYSALTFSPASTTSLSQITNLSAEYTFTHGNCYGGTMRWSIVFTDNSYIYVYYGKDSTFWPDCSSDLTDPTIDQSGLNMINANFDNAGGDVRYETSGHPGSYTTYADVLTFAAGRTINWIGLILDGAWQADQIVSLGHVTVNDNTFIPKSGNLTRVCPTVPATIQVSKIGSSAPLTIDELLVANGPDTGTQFRMVDCKYMYNLPGKSLGPGQYQVDAIINDAPATQTGIGTKFALK
jgi:hypothetical protein